MGCAALTERRDESRPNRGSKLVTEYKAFPGSLAFHGRPRGLGEGRRLRTELFDRACDGPTPACAMRDPSVSA
jgi:hypothetical protein